MTRDVNKKTTFVFFFFQKDNVFLVSFFLIDIFKWDQLMGFRQVLAIH